MWSGTNSCGDGTPNPGLMAGALFLALSTANTAALARPVCGERYAYVRIFGDLPTTSNTIDITQPVSLLHTNAGLMDSSHHSPPITALPGFHARDAIFELRRLTGLTWEELADVLGVTRRTLHLWANGQPINTINEKRVRDVLLVIRTLDRGAARQNRSLLISPQPEGGVFSDLLRGQRFNEALARAGRGPGRSIPPAPVDDKTQLEAAKLSVADMLGTSGERVHTDNSVALPRRRRPHHA